MYDIDVFFFGQGASSVIAFEILPEPPTSRSKDNPWPQFPRVFKVDYGHEEVRAKTGKDPRQFSILSKVRIRRSDSKIAYFTGANFFYLV